MPAVLRIALLLILCLPFELAAQSYHYRVKYGPVIAGTAIVTHEVDGDILRGDMRITSSPWLSNLWTLSDSIMGRYDLKRMRLIDHYKAIHEGNYHRNYKVQFSDSTVLVNNEEIEEDITGMYDLPSLLYHLSRSAFTDGDTLDFTLWDGKSYGNLTVKVEKLGRPTLLNPFPDRGWKLRPLTSTEKSREHQLELTLLFSTNYPRLPVRIHIDTKYGELVMKLED